VLVRRALAASAVALLTLLALAGCGGGDEEPDASPTSAGTSTSASEGPSESPTDDAEPEVPTNTELQQPRASATIQPKANLTSVPGASELPARNFRTVQGFPVPTGVKVKDPGPLEDTWQFDIRAADLDSVIAFYKRVLPQMGFTVRLGVTYTLGDEEVYWDLVFDGRISGTMVRDPDNGVVFVVVNPPGQKAIAGES
jgi:hypothetical protein